MKKAIIISFLVLLFISFFSLSNSYFTDTKEKDNKVTIGNNDIKIIETFNEPDDYIINKTYTKTVQFQNIGNVDCYVRAIVVPSNSDMVSSMNFDTSNWSKNGDYYYYSKALKPNESTSQLLKSVTIANVEDPLAFEVYVYVESVQSETYESAYEAFNDIK